MTSPFDEDFPSVAAILLGGHPPDEIAARVDQAFLARRYKRAPGPAPRGYPLAPGEWVGALVTPLPGEPLVAVITSDMGLFFEHARWVSAAFEDELVIAWKRLRGDAAAVAKFLVDGTPLWKDGKDPDHEVDWHVPAKPSVEARLPHRGALPETAAGASAVLAASGVLRPFPRDLVCGAQERVLCWIERSSSLA
ncbi:MAG: hypothetical protein KC635_02730 [Myxococcales bacterium]|nr:hypothetical protein [Myxococcales bacterium]MCB9736340.1 hypothetical protein [Deltaproteobacteria bacterium]